MDSNLFPVNNSPPSPHDGAFHNQHAVSQTANSTFPSQPGFGLENDPEAVLGSPFPQYNPEDRYTTPPVPLHSVGFTKTDFLPFEVSPHLELTSPASSASSVSYGRRRLAISHPRPVSYAQSPMIQPGSPMALAASPKVSESSAAAPHARTRTPRARARTPRTKTPVLSTGAVSESPRTTYTSAKDEDLDYTLKRLGDAAASWPLTQLALKVKMVETGHLALRTDPFLQALARPGKVDRAAQVFAMTWLKRATEPSASDVLPRSRLYARYAEVCADYSLTPVGPVTLGHLVRILHPTLKLRRLGGRGKSKYHYCGLVLVGSGPVGLPLLDLLQTRTPPFTTSPGLSLTVVSPTVTPGTNVTPRVAHKVTAGATPGLSAGSTPGLTPGITPRVVTPAAASTTSPGTDCLRGATDSGMGMSLVEVLEGPLSLKYVPTLFASIDAVDALAPLTLPSIYSYFSQELEVDHDIADTVHLLYRIHCSLLFELIRYLKVDRLPSVFEGLPAIMTTPVLKLFTTDEVGNWVRDCDLLTYRAIMKMLARLQLQPTSPEILAPLKTLATHFTTQMSEAFLFKLPEPFVEMKLKAARRFVALVKCLVRCIETGTAASGILSSQSDKHDMLHDWLQLDMNDLVLRELPCALETPTIISDILEKSFLELFESHIQAPPLPVFASFLFALPARFPDTSPRLFSLVLSNFLTACLREMSLNGANSFGRWWLVRCWVDEYFLWCFQLGSFLSDDGIAAVTSVDKENSFIDLMEGVYGESKMETNWI